MKTIKLRRDAFTLVELPAVSNRREGAPVRRSSGEGGFTLVELMTVMAIMAVMMLIAVGGYRDWGRGASMRGSLLNLHSAVSGSRQFAITHRVRTIFEYGNTDTNFMPRGYYVARIKDGEVLGNTNFLAEGVVFENNEARMLEFKLDGSCSGSVGSGSQRSIAIREFSRGDSSLSTTTTVFLLTGRIKVLD